MAFAPPRRAASTTIRPDGSTRSASGIASTGSTRPASVTSSSRVVRPTDATRSVRTSWIPQLSPVKPKSKAALVDGNGDDAGEVQLGGNGVSRGSASARNSLGSVIPGSAAMTTSTRTSAIPTSPALSTSSRTTVSRLATSRMSSSPGTSSSTSTLRSSTRITKTQSALPSSPVIRTRAGMTSIPSPIKSSTRTVTTAGTSSTLRRTALTSTSAPRKITPTISTPPPASPRVTAEGKYVPARYLQPSRRQAVQPETPPRRPASSLTQQDLTSTSIEKERQQRHYRTKLYQLLYEIKNFPPAHHPSTVASLKERYKALQEKEQALHKRQLGNVFQKEIRSLEEVLTLGTTVEIADAIRRAERVLAAPREAGISRLRHAKQGLGRVQTGPGRLRDVVEGMKELLRVEITVMELDREFEALRAGMEEAEVLEEFEKGWEESLSADIKSAWLSV